MDCALMALWQGRKRFFRRKRSRGLWVTPQCHLPGLHLLAYSALHWTMIDISPHIPSFSFPPSSSCGRRQTRTHTLGIPPLRGGVFGSCSRARSTRPRRHFRLEQYTSSSAVARGCSTVVWKRESAGSTRWLKWCLRPPCLRRTLPRRFHESSVTSAIFANTVILQPWLASLRPSFASFCQSLPTCWHRTRTNRPTYRPSS
jgi:hypothetical protein